MAEPAKATNGEAISLRLKWKETWPDREADYAASAPSEDHVGRIYLYNTGLQQGQWFWSLTAFGPEISRNAGNTTGFEASARAAALKVEEAWFAAIKGTSLDRPAAKGNAYEIAKAGE